MSDIKSMDEIVRFLREQATLRSPENDEGGLLREAAYFLEDGPEREWTELASWDGVNPQ